VAVKVLRPELAAVVGGERFLAEIKTTANLQHPHILPLFDSGEADGFLFYVMPYVEGETLRDLMTREKQLPVDYTVKVGSAVAGALDYAHRHGVIHRDVKPANILLDSEPVVVIGRQTAELFFAGEDPLGARLALSTDEPVWARVVGVVEGTRTASLDGELWPQAYVVQEQADRIYFAPRVMGYTLQTDLAPERMVTAIRAAVSELDKDLPLASVRTMDQAFRDMVARPRLLTHLLGAFALIALLLASVGIYGVVSYSVARRTREMGIRLALGAEVRHLSRRLVMEGIWPALLGVGLGLPLAVVSSGLVAGLLYGVSARDPVTYGVVPMILVLVALVSSYLPARRATRMAPSTALRDE